MSWPIDWQSLHLLRPWWLLALLPVLWLTWRSWRVQRSSGEWSKVVDAELLPHLLDGTEHTPRRLWPWLLLCGWTIAIIALSGPAWQKLPQPLYMKESALVILLDLSRSMDANDITPSRLTHARHKVLDILELRKEGQIGLLAYTDDAYVVSPLTDDNRTIANLVPALTSDIMPSHGSQLSKAILRANKLLDDAGFQQAQLLVISDGVDDEEAFSLAQQLAAQQRSLSVLAIGSDQGSPIPLTDGGFLKDSHGAIVISKTDHRSLQRLALAGAGRYAAQRHDGSDLKQLFPAINKPLQEGAETDRQQNLQQWRDEGAWLLLPLLILAAFAFRRGWLFSVLFCALLVHPQPSYALDWDSLWQNSDQQATKAMEQQQFQQAAELFESPLWRASALYRAEQYQQAAELFAQHDTVEAYYNQGNALAKVGKLDEAIQAYQKALEKEPNHQDSQFNLALLQSLMESQEQQSNDAQQGENGEQQPGDKQQQGEQGQQQPEQGEQSGEQQNQSQSAQQNNSKSKQPPEAGQDTESQSDDSEHTGTSPQQAAKQTENDSGEASPSQQAQLSQSESDITSSEQQQYLQQWLRRIPDDPGGLLRRKFELQHQQQQPQQDENQQSW